MADAKGNIPVLKSHGIGEAKSAIAEALGEQPKKDFQNLLKSKDLQNVKSYCYACYGELMHKDKNHFLKNCGEYSKLCSEWLNLRKRIWGRTKKTEDKIIDHLMHKALREAPEEQRVNLAKVTKSFVKAQKRPGRPTSTSFSGATSTFFIHAPSAT